MGLRAELVYTNALQDSPSDAITGRDLIVNHASGTVAIEYLFPHAVSLQGQYLYNGAGEPEVLWLGYARVGYGESFSASRHLVGLMATWEATALLRTALLAQVSGSDGSGLVQPCVVYSVSDESELIGGLAFAFGARPGTMAVEPPEAPLLPELNSEFGTAPVRGFFEYKLYF